MNDGNLNWSSRIHCSERSFHEILARLTVENYLQSTMLSWVARLLDDRIC